MIPVPSGFVSTRSSPNRGGGVGDDAVGPDDAHDRQPVFRLAVLHRVAAGDDDARLLRNVHSAEQHAPEHLLWQVLREADDVERKERSAPHGVDVAERVHRRDSAEVVGVVDDRWEEIDRLDYGQVVRQAVDGRIVARVEPDEQVIVLHVGEVAQDLAEVLRAELTGSTPRKWARLVRRTSFCCMGRL